MADSKGVHRFWGIKKGDNLYAASPGSPNGKII